MDLSVVGDQRHQKNGRRLMEMVNGFGDDQMYTESIGSL